MGRNGLSKTVGTLVVLLLGFNWPNLVMRKAAAYADGVTRKQAVGFCGLFKQTVTGFLNEGRLNRSEVVCLSGMQPQNITLTRS